MPPEETYERVVDALAAWDGDAATHHHLVADLRDHLDDALDASVERSTDDSPCDVAVGAVGVLVYTDFDQADSRALSRESDFLRREYDYLVCYGHDLPRRDLDRWRMGNFRHRLLGVDVADVSFVQNATATGRGGDADGWPSRLWRFGEAFVALLAVVIGLELAVIAEFAFPSVVAAVGPTVTFAAVVVLSAALAAIRGSLSL